ncbi:MAG: FAD-binding oxidoreductase, partial [Candidatus Fermentibacteraceae bacterium]|nr:FAD-binding oxidoreductase [Candidatus Fermentibacteraceae bacterium]
MRSVRGRKRIEEICADVLQDESNMSGSWCDLVAWPENPEQARDIMKECAGEGMPVTISGGLTGIAAGALPEGGAVISTSMMR